MSTSTSAEQLCHRNIWIGVVRKEMTELRKLPYDSVHRIFSNKLRHFDDKYANEFVAKKRNNGEMRAVEWLITELLNTEFRWPEALVAVLQENNMVLLERIHSEFRRAHDNSGKLNTKKS